MKTTQQKELLEISPDKVDWIMLTDEGPKSTQEGVGFYGDDLIYWRGVAQKISLRRSIEVYKQITDNSVKYRTSFTEDVGAVSRWMDKILKAFPQ